MQPAIAPRIMSNLPQDHVHSEHILREQHLPPHSLSDHLDNMRTTEPSPPNDSGNPEALTGSADSDENNGDGRKGYGKRELSTSKRAAQNRAAQRAFRQRKEGYIKKLEEQVRDYQVLSENFKAVQAENYQLRDYIINLQSRLLESQGEVPPPPSNVDGLQPGKAGQPPQVGTLPRLSELGAPPPSHPQQHESLPTIHPEHHRSGYPDPTYSEPPSSKRVRTTSAEMTPSQAALQGPSILTHSPQGAR